MFVPMKTTLRGRQRLTDREGKCLVDYRDSKGIPTAGVGHTAAAGKPIPVVGTRRTAQEVDDILTRDLVRYEKILNAVLTIETADHEFDAMLSIVYNVESFAHSTAVKLHNAGDKCRRDAAGHIIGGCAFHILDWNKPPEIIGRRHTEQSQYVTPYTQGVK